MHRSTLAHSIARTLRAPRGAGGAVTFVAAALLAGASPALAAGAGAPAPAAESAGGLEDVIVTARKRTESAQDVPVTVTAVSGEDVRKQDLTTLEKIAASVPNFTIGRASNGSAAQITLRGVGSNSTSIGIEQSVAVVVDGVYYGQGRVIEEGFFDLAQLEILKGPQALFFGKNATAGVISITTADPTREPEIRTRLAYEVESQQTTADVIVSGPLSETLAGRISLRGSYMNGGLYRNIADPITYTTVDVANGFAPTPHVASPAEFAAPGERGFVARATLKWEPSDSLTGTLKLSASDKSVNNSSWNYMGFRCPTGRTSLGVGYPCGFDFVTHQNNLPVDIAATVPYAKSDGALYNDYKSYAITGTLNWDLESYTLTSVANYQRNNNKWTCACDYQSSSNATWATENSTWWAASEELRLLSKFDSPLNFMVGGLYQKTRRDFGQWIIFAGIEDSSAAPQNRYLATSKDSFTEGETISIFGQAIWKITPTIEATAGVRYTDETKDSFFVQPYNNTLVTAIFRPANVPFGIVTANQKFEDWSPEVTVSWKPVDDVMFYGAFKTGYKSGGFDNGGINSAFIAADPATYMTFEPERARGFEVGVKSTLLDNQLRANFTIHSYKYKDLQVDFFNSGTFAFQTVPADARTRGAELELEYAPRSVDGLTLRGVLSYNDAEYTDFIGPCYAGQTISQGCSIPTATLPFQNLKSEVLAVAPKLTGAVGVRYAMPVGSAGSRLDWMVDARYSDDYLASAFGHPLSKVSSYVNLDAGVRWVTADEKYEFALLGKNITNEAYVGGAIDGPSTGSASGGTTGTFADQFGFGNLPRTWQFEVSARF